MLSFLPQNVLGEIGDLLESDSEGFPTYSSIEIFVVFFLILNQIFAMNTTFTIWQCVKNWENDVVWPRARLFKTNDVVS